MEESKKSFVVDFDGKRRKLSHNEMYEIKDLGDVEMDDVSDVESTDEFVGPTSLNERTFDFEAATDERGSGGQQDDGDSLAYSEANEEDSLGDDEESLLGLAFVIDDEGMDFGDEDTFSLDGEASIEEEEEEAVQVVEEVVVQDLITLPPSTQRSPRTTLRRSLRLETRGLGSVFTASGRRYSHRLAGTA